MTIGEVCARCHITPDTLRYYERMGAIPAVGRTRSGMRDYTQEDIGWVENTICMRSAGVPVEMIARYLELCLQGDSTFSARRDLLQTVREGLVRQIEKSRRELERLEYKIGRYEAALETGELVWDRAYCFDPETGTFGRARDGAQTQEETQGSDTACMGGTKG